MRQEQFKMERQGLIRVGDVVEISEFQSYMNYSYIIEPAVAMSGCYKNSERIKAKTGPLHHRRGRQHRGGHRGGADRRYGGRQGQR